MTVERLIVICRETDKNTGEIAVYSSESEVTGELLTSLKVRARFNPELRYFVTDRARWAGVWQKDIISVLKQNSITPEAIKLLGGIVEL